MNNPETHGSVQQLARDGEALPVAGEVLVEVGQIFDSYIAEACRARRETRAEGLTTAPTTYGIIEYMLTELKEEVVGAIKRRISVASDKLRHGEKNQ